MTGKIRDYDALRREMERRILVLDGSMGVEMQKKHLSEQQVRGRRFMTHTRPIAADFDVLNITAPEVVEDVYQSYIDAGADIIETNTFNSNRLSQHEYRLEDHVAEMNLFGARIARRIVDRAVAADGQRRFVAGSMGPTGMAASIASDMNDAGVRSVTFAQLEDAYAEQAGALIDGGVDALLIETIFDSLNAKAAIAGSRRAMEERGVDVPMLLSLTISEKSHRILSGQNPEAFLAMVRSYNPLAIGFNCSAGPDSLAEPVRRFAELSPAAVIFYPNAGLPDQMGRYSVTPDEFAADIEPLAREGYLNIVGGCCGTTPDFIRAVAGRVRDYKPRAIDSHKPVAAWLAGSEPFYDNRGFINVGERCNVAGSRKFLRLVKEGNYDECVTIARKQVENGAMVIDINMDDGLLDSKACMERFTRLLASDPLTASVPWMIDSSDMDVIETALQNVPGKAIVNSISLKHGEEAFLADARRVARYGAAVVVMLFDEQGQATTYDRKVEIADRSIRLLTERAGYDPRDIIIDSNVLTIATGMPEHDAYALDFIRAVEWISKHWPGVKTSGGLSNLSFAFRGNNFLRQAMHAVFLYHAMQRGLTMAIMDPTAKVTYSDIPEDLLELIEDAILMRRPDAAERLIEAAPRYDVKQSTTAAQSVSTPRETMSLEDRLKTALRNGDDTYLAEDLEDALKKYPAAADIVGGPLMAGMELVGKLFEEGKVFLPQVVKCARTMQRAVDYLKPYMLGAAADVPSKGKFLLATVKGDVHDIGKNIVQVVLHCNGYEVVDLGVQVDAATIVKAAKEEKPDFIGLSGLISPSLDEMAKTAEALRHAGIDVPLFIGGAATSPLHTALKIAPAYGNGLVIRVNDAAQNPVIAARLASNPTETGREICLCQQKLVAEYKAKQNAGTSRNVPKLQIEWEKERITEPSFMGERVLEEIPVGKVRPYINWIYFTSAWRMKPGTEEADKLLAEANEILDMLEREGCIMRAAVSFREAYSEQDAIVAGDVTIPTPRQEPGKKRDVCLALSDFVAPAPHKDFIGAFMVTIGDRMRTIIDEAKESDVYRHLLLQSVADRLAEATSEWLHRQVRTDLWGYVPDEPEDMDMILKEQYQGIRPAVGYPSLPDQKLMHKLAQLVTPSSLGVTVTENGALSPSSTVAGLYIASPHARYFTL